jgi:succinyl-CoA synthetase beta subunit
MSVHYMRQATVRIVGEGEGRPIAPAELSLRHASAVAVDFARAAVLTLAAVWLAGRVNAAVEGHGSAAGTAALVLLAAAGLGLGADLGVMARGRAVATAFGVGFLLSLGLWIWLSWGAS